MKFIALCALASASLATTLHAGLGDTQTEIYKHYGKPIGRLAPMTNQDLTEIFEYNKKTLVVVTFVGGQCQRENYKKKDKTGFSDDEIQKLLDASANGRQWMLMNDNDHVKIWVQDSKEAFAGYYKDKDQPFLSLETIVMLQFNNSVKEMMQKAQQQPQKQVPQPPPQQQTVPHSLRP